MMSLKCRFAVAIASDFDRWMVSEEVKGFDSSSVGVALPDPYAPVSRCQSSTIQVR